jgi:hypothetical protein
LITAKIHRSDDVFEMRPRQHRPCRLHVGCKLRRFALR